MEDFFSRDWTAWLAAVAALAIALTLVFWGWRKTRTRRDRSRRIAAARVRSGHVPLEIPTVPAVLTGNESADDFDEGGSVVVDEQPRLHLSFVDPQGKLTERIVKVERLDLMRNVILARGDFGGEVQTVPLDRIRRARNAQSGKAFSLRTWVDAVRVARRRREIYGSGHADTPNQIGW